MSLIETYRLLNKTFILMAMAVIASSITYAGTSYVDWEGDVSSDWNDADNWEGNSFPDGSDVAVIDGDVYTNPPIINSDATWTTRYLQVLDAGVLTVNAALSITRYGGIETGGVMTINTGGSFSTGSGSREFTVSDDNSVLNISGGSLTTTGDLEIDGNNDGTGAAPTVNFSSGTMNIGSNILFGGDSDELPVFNMTGGTLNVDGGIDHLGTDVAPIDFNISGSSDIDLAGDIIMDNATDDITMSSGNMDVLTVVSASFDNDGSFNMSGGTFTSNTALTMTGTGTAQFYNLNIATGESITQSVSSISVAGDWGNSGTFTPGTNTVVINGSSDQSITGSSNFYNLTINKSGGGVNLNDDITIDSAGALTLTQGIINSDSTNTLTMSNGATTNGGDADSYVDGYMIKVGNDDPFVFPLGDQGMWMRMEINDFAGGGSNTDIFEAEYVRGTHPEAFWDSLTYGGDNGGMYNTSILDYWKLYRTNGTTDVKVKLYWEEGDSTQITDLADLVVAHYTGSAWEDLGGTTTGSAATGTVETSNRVTSFSPFTFGSGSSSSNPLPITLSKFSAAAEGDVVKVSWTTQSEINNDYFEVERSIDGTNYEVVNKINGAGNSSVELNYESFDNSPYYNQFSYYRLSQTDYDGTKSYSKTVAVYVDSDERELEVRVFPNPVSGEELFIAAPQLQDQELIVHIYDRNGRLISSEQLPANEDGIITISSPKGPGMYIVKIIGEGTSVTERFIVE